MLKDCYAFYDSESGRITLGNSRIEKTIRINGSCIRTEKITDKTAFSTWSGDVNLWQRCPVLGSDETPETVFETAEILTSHSMMPHLKAELKMTGINGAVRYEYIVFPDIPFIYTCIYAERKDRISAQADEAEDGRCSGIETDKIRNNGNDIYCSADTLDCIPLRDSHLRMETYELRDKTDINDDPVEKHETVLYRRGKAERDGNIFLIHDYPKGESLLLVRHAPCAGAALNRRSKDITVVGNRYALLAGTGVDFDNMSEGEVPYYASAVGIGRTSVIRREFMRYSKAFSCGDPGGELFIMSNTWGDRSRDAALCEGFMLKELERAHELGVDIVQIDDGWQKGVSANSMRGSNGLWEGFHDGGSGFWDVDPVRFPNGLDPIIKKADEYGIGIGLWFAPDSSNEFGHIDDDIETIWRLYRRYHIRYFKLDGVKIRSKAGEMRFIRFLRELTERSGGDIRFNLDVTAEDRFGYLYQTQYGTLFVENRYTDWGNYYPHHTFRNLWKLASVLPARRLQMELLNNRRNADKYKDMPFAPAKYGMDYLFASVMPSNPLLWMEISRLDDDQTELLRGIMQVYRKYRRELFESDVIPIGSEPDGMSFSGYMCVSGDGETAHLILFREETAEEEHEFDLPVSVNSMAFTVPYSSSSADYSMTPHGVKASFGAQRSFIWLRGYRG